MLTAAIINLLIIKILMFTVIMQNEKENLPE